MEVHDIKRKQDTEIAKARLEETRQKLGETLTRLSKAEDELQESRVQWGRKIKNLEKIKGTQFCRMSKLNSDMASIQMLLQTRLDEEGELKKANAELLGDLKKCQNDILNADAEFQKKFDELEEQITSGYKQIQNEKDAEVVLEVGMSSFKSEEQVPFAEGYLQEVLTKRKEMCTQREEGLKNENDALDEALKEVEKEIDVKAEELAGLRDKNVTLNKILAVKSKEN